MLLRKMLLIGKVDNTLSKKIIEIAFTARYADGDFVASDSEPVTPFPGIAASDSEPVNTGARM